jgi:hypothetical protein
MIEIGDSVEEDGDNQVLTVVGYSSAKDQFQVQRGNNPIPPRFVDRSRLKLVKKAPGNDLVGPGLIPEGRIL